MSIQILTINNFLVVDSRLIADELGIEHRALRQTIEKYINEVQEFGVVTFQMSKPLESSQGGRPERYCHLNEDQATYVMTLSKNTDKVRNCKRNLVKAFSEAKKIIKEVIPTQSDRIRELELENENLRLKTNYMDRRDAICQLHGTEMLALLDGNIDIVPVREVLTETVVCRDGRNVSFVGQSVAEMAKELGFRAGRELEQWLKQQKQEHLICQGMRAVQAPYIPEENIKIVKDLFSRKRRNSTRQMLIGEQ